MTTGGRADVAKVVNISHAVKAESRGRNSLRRRNARDFARLLPVYERAVRRAWRVLVAAVMDGYRRAHGLRKAVENIDVEFVDWKKTGGEMGKVLAPAHLKIMEVAGNTLYGVGGIEIGFDVLRPEFVERAKTDTAKLVTGVIEETKQTIRGTVAEGIRRGRGAEEIGRKLRGVIGLSPRQQKTLANYAQRVGQDMPRIMREARRLRGYRAYMISRTETARARAEGQIDAYRQINVTMLEFMYSGPGAGQDVCPECSPLDGKLYTANEAMGVIPVHPNCLCSFVAAKSALLPQGFIPEEPQILEEAPAVPSQAVLPKVPVTAPSRIITPPEQVIVQQPKPAPPPIVVEQPPARVAIISEPTLFPIKHVTEKEAANFAESLAAVPADKAKVAALLKDSGVSKKFIEGSGVRIIELRKDVFFGNFRVDGLSDVAAHRITVGTKAAKKMPHIIRHELAHGKYGSLSAWEKEIIESEYAAARAMAEEKLRRVGMKSLPSQLRERVDKELAGTGPLDEARLVLSKPPGFSRNYCLRNQEEFFSEAVAEFVKNPNGFAAKQPKLAVLIWSIM